MKRSPLPPSKIDFGLSVQFPYTRHPAPLKIPPLELIFYLFFPPSLFDYVALVLSDPPAFFFCLSLPPLSSSFLFIEETWDFLFLQANMLFFLFPQALLPGQGETHVHPLFSESPPPPSSFCGAHFSLAGGALFSFLANFFLLTQQYSSPKKLPFQMSFFPLPSQWQQLLSPRRKNRASFYVGLRCGTF